MATALDLARFAHQAGRLEDGGREAVLRVILDLFSSSLFGLQSPGARAAVEAARKTWGAGSAQSWFSATRLPPAGAAFANSAVASMLDIDDGHRAAAGHPGASIIPAVLAEADVSETTADRLLTAIAVGYEIGIRVSAARDFTRLETLASGLWSAHGAAAAVAYMRALPAPLIAQAIAIAGTMAPNLASIGYTRQMGTHVKEGIPWSTATGVSAVDLAEAGFTGPLDILDDKDSFDREMLLDGLGQSWLVETVYFKPYSCCRWGHAAIDATLELAAENRIEPGSVRAIEIEIFGRALRLNNEIAPTTLESAQYSIPFTVALALNRGRSALLPLTEASLADRATVDLAGLVRLIVDPQFDRMFSARVPSRVTIATNDRVLTKTVLDPKGEPANPMSWQDLVDKLKVAAQHCDRSFSDELVAAVEALDGGNVASLRSILGRPLMRARA
jgi:2-methylcitrate dehydratase PrpD